MARPGFRRATTGLLRARGPELALEAFSVVLAVLFALAVDQWWQSRQDAELAQRARARVESEIESNLAEISDARGGNDAIVVSMTEAISRIEDGAAAGALSVDFSLALLSDAAWETAKVTRAVNHMEFDWVAEVARVYDIQSRYQDAQGEVVRYISGMGGREGSAEPLAGLLSRVRTALEIEDGLARGYRRLLEGATLE